MPMLGILIDLPSATTTLQGIGAYSNPIFSEMLPYLYPVIAIVLIGAFIGWVMNRGK